LGFWNRLKQKAETTKDLTKPPGFNESPRDQNVHRTPKILTASSLKKEFENKNHGKRLNQRRPAGFIRSNKKKN